MVETIQVTRYRFDIEAVEPLRLPAYKGSTLRGGFGYAFKRMVCAMPDWHAPCDTCLRGNACPYGYIFETRRPENSEVLRSLQEVPLPFVIEPPLDRRTRYAPGDRLAFHVTLIGKANAYLPYFLLAFQELGRQGLGYPPGKYALQRIVALHPWESRQVVMYDGVDMRAGASEVSVSLAEVEAWAAHLSAGQITLNFLTPTRLKHGGDKSHPGDYARQPDFHILIRALLRRISSQAYFHCDHRWEADYRGLIAAAEAVTMLRTTTQWVDWERYSSRQQQRMNLGGLVGEVTYVGDIRPFHVLLALGTLLHVGKAAVFGNGKYCVVA